MTSTTDVILDLRRDLAALSRRVLALEAARPRVRHPANGRRATILRLLAEHPGLDLAALRARVAEAIDPHDHPQRTHVALGKLVTAGAVVRTGRRNLSRYYLPEDAPRE